MNLVNPYLFATPLLLSKISGSNIAYSLRKINNTYTSKILTVRRSSDNTSLDVFALPNNELDIASLTAFVGSGTGYVSFWADQSGNNYHMEQTNTVYQPNIINAGVLNTLNGKPCIKFGIHYMATPIGVGLGDPSTDIYTGFLVGAKNSNGSLVSVPGSSGYYVFRFNSTSFVSRHNSTITATIADAPTLNTQILISAIRYDASNIKYYRDGVLKGDQPMNGNWSPAINKEVGIGKAFIGNPSYPDSSTYQEIIFYQRDLLADYNIVEQDLKNYYNTY